MFGGCSDSGTKDPRAVLTRAKNTLDTSPTVAFTLTSADLPSSGAVLVSGDGVAKRPASFSGRFRLATGGIAVTLGGVVSVEGTLYAQLPFRDGYTATDPDDLGVADPALLLDPRQGLSSFLTSATDVRGVGRSRAGREVTAEFSARLPAKVVSRLFVVADDSAAVETHFFVAEETGQLRKATFRGPFYSGENHTTYTVVLDHYGAPVPITRPR
nr:LppX_LprAFG lipoprotein [Actinopolymorpha pittospori]